jgi:UDP-N-acetylglucosamine:LPS N-acetylglucosamine transferase
MKKNKIRVLLINVDAGGGHRALRDNFIRSLDGNEDIELRVFNSDVKVFDKAYKGMLKIPKLWKWAQGIADKKPWYYFARIAAIIPEVKNSDRILEEFNPDIVLTTNPISSVVFYNLRRTYHLDYKIVTGIPDYGDQRTYLHGSEPADYYLVRDAFTKEQLSKYIDKNKLVIFGTSVNEAFINAGKLNANGILPKFTDFMNTYFPTKSLDMHKKSILVMGGAAWAYKSKTLIKKLNKLGLYNIFVSCGSDNALRVRLQKYEHIYPLPMLPQEDLALIEKFVDITILSSLAPATMHELFTINKYPLFLHSFIKGQESPHVPLLSDWNIGIYEPNDEKMLQLIEKYLQDPDQYSSMLSKMREIRSLEVEKAKENVEIIRSIGRERE